MKNYKAYLFLMLLVLVSAACLLVSSCGKSADPEARVLLIGLDGIEMNILEPLLEKGELPNLAGLIDRGVFGYLRTFKPTFSPVVWTSIGTGKTPDQHKISGFLDPNTRGPFTSHARRGKAVWNIVSDYGLTCNVTGYWITYPAESINGHMISQVTTLEQYDDVWKGMLYEDVEDATYPSGFIKELWPEVERYQTPEFLKGEVIPQVFGEVEGDSPIASDEERLVKDSNWSFAGDFVYCKAAEYLLERYPGNLDIVYLGGTDVVGHRFWRYRDPELYSKKPRQRYIDAFGDAIDNYYRLTDKMLGELLARVPENTRVIVLSDHGMHPDFLNGKDDFDNRTILSAHHLDAPPGIIIAAGANIRKGPGLASILESEEPEELGTVLDVTPTILYLLDIPLGRDMKGGKVMKKVVDEALLTARPIEHIDTHDIDFRPPTSSRISKSGEKAFIEKFKGLGYIK